MQYIFRDKSNRQHEVIMTVAEVMACKVGENQWEVPGLGRCTRDFAAEQSGMLNTAWSTPLLSDAAAVHPDQIPEACEHSQKHGVPVDFHPDGRAIFTSRSQRKKYLRLIGMFDKSGSYGD